MHKLYVFVLFFCTILASLLIVQPSHAISKNVVISQIKVGNSSTSRLVEIYNNSNEPVDVTDWCLEYSSPSNTLPYTNLGCFSGTAPNVHVNINARSFALLSSVQTGLVSDIILTAGLGAGTSGHVYLMGNNGIEIDRVGWGVVDSPEGKPAILGTTKVIERKKDVVSGALIDTDNNESDFMNSTLRSVYQYGAIYEVIDVCSNLIGIQEVVPVGYTVDVNGNCNPPPVDVCTNLGGLQTVVPDGYFIDVNDLCQPDVCPNLDGIQKVTPDGYELNDEGKCLLDLLPLKITEILPNPVGSDEGNEFIEIFNPNINDVKLDDYLFRVGSSDTDYAFPIGSIIGAGKYAAFFNDDIKFTLVNTASKISLWSADGQLIDETPFYINPNDGMAWALIGGVWQYTDQPTPGSSNVASSVEIVGESLLTVGLEPCASSQYRSIETNRCRLISTSNSVLAPCKDGQYRSEETNRCRSVASDVSALTQCAEGQERNPDTNRCRSVSAVLGVSDLAPCKANQERSPDTNRCRNVASAIPTADFAPEQTNESSNNYVLWWSLAVVGTVAISYGVWEWRHEIYIGSRKFTSFLNHNK